ncbi:S1C family serine protease [Parafrigoribacterium humi]|uniref:S1C family serine protease n=1 Tax=Parafrigoribacterium humi TaxID=3144664 RepID=UPI0032EEB77A
MTDIPQDPNEGSTPAEDAAQAGIPAETSPATAAETQGQAPEQTTPSPDAPEQAAPIAAEGAQAEATGGVVRAEAAAQPAQTQSTSEQPTAAQSTSEQPTAELPPAMAEAAAPTSPAGPPTGSGPARSWAAPAPAASRRRSRTVGLVAALAVGALVGGVAGAGVYALATNGNQGVQATTSTAVNPANITVNDRDNATLITKVAAQATPSVVTISVTGTNSAGTGSGVILSKDGYILTNTHVVTLDGEVAHAKVKVETSDGHLYNAKVIGTDPISDLAVVKVDGVNDFQPLQFADSSKLNVGDTAIAIGAPLALSNTVTNGIVSALNRSITIASSAVPDNNGDNNNDNNDNNGNGPFDFWQFGTPNNGQQQSTAQSSIALAVVQTDAAINPGNSGGALLDTDGKVIGINVAIASAGSGSSGSSASGSIGVGFAIPSNFAKRIANELIAGGKATHGLLGASVSDVADDPSTANSSVVGASIVDVTSGGAAATAGLQKGDIVTSFNGVPIGGKTDLTAQVRVLAAGAKTQLNYVRNGKTYTVNVTLGALK